MLYKVSPVVYFALLAGAAMPLSVAGAQTVDDRPSASVGEIIVTARKKEEVLTNVPVTVNVVTEADLYDKRLNDMAALGDTVPNVIFASDSSSRSRVSVRGVGPDNTGTQGPGVGFYIDGVYQPTTAAMNTPFFDLERIEVLKGPQGTLYGRNALGGVINYITPRPSNDFKASAQGEVGNFGTYRAAAAINIPLIKDMLLLRISGQHAQSDGPWKYDASGKDLAPTNFDSVRARLLFIASDRLEFDLSGSYYDFKGVALPFSNVPDLQNLVEAFKVNPPNISNNDERNINLAITYDFDGFQILSRSSYFNFKNYQDVDSDLGGADLLRSLSDPKSTVKAQELRLQSTNDSAFQWMIGGSFNEEDVKYSSTQSGAYIDNNVFGGVPGSKFVNDADSKTKVWSAFADITFAVDDKLELGAGVRYDDIKMRRVTEQYGQVDGITIPFNTIPQDLKQDSIQPKFTVRYKFTPELAAFATAAKGFRQGGFNPSSAGTYAASYRGDVLWSYEAGLKWSSADGRASANASAFYIDWQKVTGTAILPSTVGAPSSGVAAFGSARSYGFELDGQIRFTDHLTYSGSLGILDCRYTKIADNAGAGIEVGGTCIDSSTWNMRHELSFNYPVNDSGLNFFASANASIRGDTRIGVDVNDDDKRQVQHGYVLAGASVGLKTDQWTLTVFGDNIFNKRYANTIYTKEFVAAFGAQEDAIIFGSPRTYGLRLRYTY